MRHILRFPKATVRAGETGEFAVLSDMPLVGPYSLYVDGQAKSGASFGPYVDELRLGKRVVLENLWAQAVRRETIEDDRFELGVGVQALVRVRNPFGVDVDVTVLLYGHQNELEPPALARPIAEVLDERLNATRDKLRKIAAGVARDLSESERRLVDRAAVTRANLSARALAGLPVATTMGVSGGGGYGGAGSGGGGGAGSGGCETLHAGSGQYRATTLTGSGGGGNDGNSRRGYSNALGTGSGGGAVEAPPALTPAPEPLRTEEQHEQSEATLAEKRAQERRHVEATRSGMTDAERRALHAYNRDVDASLARQLELLRPVDEAEDAAWESPTDEWP